MMFDKRWCRLVWLLTVFSLFLLAIWQINICSDSSILITKNYILGEEGKYLGIVLPIISPINYLPLLPNNVSTVPHPYQIKQLPNNDFSKLIDLNKFTFTTSINICNSSVSQLVIVVIISATSNFERRRKIRNTWGQSVDFVFIVGETSSSEVAEELEIEKKQYSDVVQGTFLDSYRNLTYKHVMAFKWIIYYCPSARYILKIDDDVFVNTPLLFNILENNLSPLGGRRLIMCNVQEHEMVKRSYRSKWRVSPLEYSGRWYPRYCAGWVVLFTPDVIFTLYKKAQKAPFFWIDDMHITGSLVKQTNFTHTHLGSLSQTHSGKIKKVVQNNGPVNFLFGLLFDKYFVELWDIVNKSVPNYLNL